MVKINCLECGKSLKIPSYIDPEDYDGQVRCHECNALLYIRFKSSKVETYKVVEKQTLKEQPNITVVSEKAKKLTEEILKGKGTE